MYARFFGLERDAFSIAPDPRYLFMSERHREALAHLLYGLDGGGGFVLLTGEIGTGKTTVCRCFLEQVPPNCNVAYLFNPRLSALELLQSICYEFGVVPSGGTSGGAAATSLRDCIDALNRFLLDAHAQGRNNVLVVDEAQNLSAEVLEQLRLLTNLETSEKKLLQIVLIGQPELREMLARPELEQLAQRVIARYHLGPLGASETEHYIRHRMAVAGLVGPLPFEPAALRRIHALTSGVPRRINLLAGRALLGAYALGAHRIDRRIVARAAREVFVPHNGKKKRRSIALGLASPRDAAASSPRPGGHGNRPSRMAGLPMAAAMLMGVIVVIVVISSTGVPEFLRGTWHAPIAVKIAGFVGMHRDADPLVRTPSASGANAVAAATTASGKLGDEGIAGSSAGLDAAKANLPATAILASSAAPFAAASVDAVSFASFAAALPVSEDEAWRGLAGLWRADVPQLPAADDIGRQRPVCQTLSQSGLRCLQMPRAALSVLRQLDRPGIVTLRRNGTNSDAHNESVGYALLTGLDDHSATLVAPGDPESAVVVPLDLLTTRWRGAFDTLWRAAPGDGESGAADRAALARQLATLQQAKESAKTGEPVSPGNAIDAASATPAAQAAPVPDQHEVIYRFQLAHGLTPDGMAGPLTRMQLNRATNVAEPRLTRSSR